MFFMSVPSDESIARESISKCMSFLTTDMRDAFIFMCSREYLSELSGLLRSRYEAFPPCSPVCNAKRRSSFLPALSSLRRGKI